MSLKSYQCGNCGANLSIDLEDLTATCPFCGQKLTFDMEDMAEIMAEREKTKRMQTEQEEATKRHSAQLEHDEKIKKIESDADNFMEGAAAVTNGINTVSRGLGMVKTIVGLIIAGVIGFSLIILLIVILLVLK